VALSGTGIAPTAELQFSQTTVSFGSQLLNVVSNQVTVYLVNRGTTALNINSIALGGAYPGDYSESIAAPEALSPPIAHAPSTHHCAHGTGTPHSHPYRNRQRHGQRTPDHSHRVGVNPTTAVSFYPSSLAFSAQPVGTGSTQQFFSVVNTGANEVNITGVASATPPTTW